MQNVLVRPQAEIIQPHGSLSAANLIKFQDQLNSAVLSDQNSRLLIDMRQVESIDSDGLMVLVSAWKLAKRLNKRFSLCSVSRSIRIVFELTQLDRVFEILDGHPVYEELAA